MKAVIDTNIWISYLLGGLLQELDKWILSGEIKLAVSDKMLKEFSEVVNRPKLKPLFQSERVKELFALLDNYAVVVSPTQRTEVCRDPKDNFLLEAALEGNVDCIITGDDDLLILDPFYGIRILTPADFKVRMQSPKGIFK